MELRHEQPILIVFRNDDLSACCNVRHERRIAALFEGRHCVQTVGVIPFCTQGDFRSRAIADRVPLDANQEMTRLLIEGHERGLWEIALHGWSHQTNLVSIPARREYMEFRGLPSAQQREMLTQGADHIRQVVGVKPVTFIPPWNLLDENTVEASKAVGFKVISAGPYSPPAEGITSLGMNCDLGSFPQRLGQALLSVFSSVLVINYHSRLLRSAADTEALERAIELASATRRCKVVTLAQAATEAADIAANRNEAGRAISPRMCCPESMTARTGFYLQELGKVGLCRSLRVLTETARDAYYAGDYARARQLADEADRKGTRLIGASRWAGLVMGLLLAAGMALPVQAGFSQVLLILQGCTAIAVTALGGILWYRATAKGTRAEIAVLTVLVVSGLLLGGLCSVLAFSK
jgi:hypothetical protein